MSLSDVIVAGPLRRRAFFRRGPWQALVALVGWYAAIALANLILSGLLIIGSFFVVGAWMKRRVIEDVSDGLVDLYAPEHSAALVWCVVFAVIFQSLALGVVSLRLGRISGQGDTHWALGNRPIRHPLPVIGLALAALGVVALTPVAEGTDSAFLLRLLDDIRGAASLGLGWQWYLAEVMLLLDLVLLAPIGEELFFRGWIWTELRRVWSAGAVMLATCIPFLAAHVLLDWRLLGFYLPGALALTLARQIGGGVRASILCHATYNAGVCAILLMR